MGCFWQTANVSVTTFHLKDAQSCRAGPSCYDIPELFKCFCSALLTEVIISIQWSESFESMCQQSTRSTVICLWIWIANPVTDTGHGVGVVKWLSCSSPVIQSSQRVMSHESWVKRIIQLHVSSWMTTRRADWILCPKPGSKQQECEPIKRSNATMPQLNERMN